MTLDPLGQRPLGTMIAHGFAKVNLLDDLAIARRLGASVLEILPDWKDAGDPLALAGLVRDSGFAIHSAHGCWGPQTIRARRVDLGSLDPSTHEESVDDLKRCLDWLASAGGTCLIVHPGGLSMPEDEEARRAALSRGLVELADHVSGSKLVVCVENMPRGVYPGSRMADLAHLLAELDRPELALALDTGHAHLNTSPQTETLAAGAALRTTHVHDNDGRRDIHLPPGLGTIDWPEWARALDAIDYRGPIILECIRHLRDAPETLSNELIDRLNTLL